MHFLYVKITQKSSDPKLFHNLAFPVQMRLFLQRVFFTSL